MQVGSQIAFQAEDNRRFAQSILVDEQLQYLLEENVKGNEFRRQNQYDKVTKRLVFYNNLRTYLEGSVLQMADGNFSEAVTAPGQCLSEAKIKAEGTGRIHCKEGMDLFRSLL